MMTRANGLGGADPSQQLTTSDNQKQIASQSNEYDHRQQHDQAALDEKQQQHQPQHLLEAGNRQLPARGSEGDYGDTMELEDDNFSAVTTRAVRSSSTRYFSTRQLQERDVGSVTGSAVFFPRKPINNFYDATRSPREQQAQQTRQAQLPQQQQAHDQVVNSNNNQPFGLMGPPEHGGGGQAEMMEERMMMEDDDDISTLTEYSMEEDDEDNNSQTTSQTSISQTTSVITAATDSTTVPTSHIFPGAGGGTGAANINNAKIQHSYPSHLQNRSKRNMVQDNQLSNSQFKRRKRS